MCGSPDFDSSLSDSSSDDEFQSMESFQSNRSERRAREWACTILTIYSVTALGFMVIFLVWFCNKTIMADS